jgi:hypothetical protein
MSESRTHKVAKMYSGPLEKGNFEEFDKDQYQGELVKKEQHFKDCFNYIERLKDNLIVCLFIL